MVILHEMAHMWFGDLVTMRWWDDLWLNESFAEFCATLSSAEATRFTDAWTTFCSGRKAWGYMQDQQPSTHPVAADVPTLGEAIANFDGISYAKGASVLKQLVAYLGRDELLRRDPAPTSPSTAGATPRSPTCCARWRPAPAQAWPTGRRRGWRPPGRTRCGREFSVGRGRRVHRVRRAAGGAGRATRRCGRTTSRSACTTGPATRSPGAHQVEVDVAGPRTAVPELAGPAAARPDPAQRRRPRLRDRPVRPAVAGHADRSIGQFTRLAGAHRVLERGDRHGAAGGAVAARVRPDPGGRHGPASRRSRCCRSCTR